MAWVFFGVGLALLLIGGGALARGGSALLRGLGFSPFLVRLLIASLAMSMPELAVSLLAAARQQPEIAVATVTGSNIANILLVLGLAALVRPVSAPPKVVFRDGLFLAVAILALIVAAMTGWLTQAIGSVMLAGLIFYVAACFATEYGRHTRISLASTQAFALADDRTPTSVLNLLAVILGGVFLYFGARYTFDGALALALKYQLPAILVALSLMSLGTALPEASNALSSTVRGDNPYLCAQILGSCIFNILFVLGLTAVLHPLAIAPSLAWADIPAMGAAALVLMPLMLSGWRITRFGGLTLVAGYLAYAGFLAWRQGLLPFTL